MTAGLAAPAAPGSRSRAAITFAPVVRRLLFYGLGAQVSLGVGLNAAFGLPETLKWADEALVIGLAALMLVAVGTRLRAGRWVAWAGAAFSAYSIIAVVSGVVNRVSAAELLIGWRSLAQYYLFFMALVWLRMRRTDLERFFVGVLATISLHVPLAARQFLAARAAGRIPYDDVTGGFGVGTANLLGYFSGMVVVVCLCLALVAGRRRYWLVIPPVAGMWIMANAVGSYVAFGAVAALALVVSRELHHPRRLIPFAGLLVVAAITFGVFTVQIFGASATRVIGAPLKLLGQSDIDDFGNPGRLRLMSSAFDLISLRGTTLLVGMGTGSVGTLLGPGVVPSNFHRLADTSAATFVSASAVQYLAENGVLGLLLNVGVLAALFGLAWRAWRRSRTKSSRAWSLALLLMVPFAGLAGFGELGWTFQALMYPCLALAVYGTRLAGARPRAQGARRATSPVIQDRRGWP